MGKYKCSKCSKEFSNEFELKKHEKNCVVLEGTVNLEHADWLEVCLDGMSVYDFLSNFKGKKAKIVVEQ